jgi:hypothetical protein
VRLKIVDRFNFSIGGNHATDGSLLDNSSSYSDSIVPARDKGGQDDHGCDDGQSWYPPTPPRTVSIQWHTEKKASFNVSSARYGIAGQIAR